MALDLLRFGAVVHCADKLTSREATENGWEREISLSIPAMDPVQWQSATDTLTEALCFLSGDRWSLRFRESCEQESGARVRQSCDAICLFSGGLDSLAGAIDLLEDGLSVCLVGHYDTGLTHGRQLELAEELGNHYGNKKVTLLQVFLRPSPRRDNQVEPLPHVTEKSTRARSFLFIAMGLAVANTIGDSIPLYVPENGFIGINVPLTAARRGSLSTRTTHPFFLRRLEDAFAQLGIMNTIRNPYRLKSKGEVIAESRNRGLLARLAPRTISCAHPEASRFSGQPQGNCGYCYPCLIRRASLHHAHLDSAEGYAYDVLSEQGFVSSQSSRPSTLKAVMRNLSRTYKWSDVLRNGPIPGNERIEFEGVFRRGQEELREWLLSSPENSLRRLLPESMP
ncbi:MAG: Qat anti-phage system QueC-like protein QatC [Actinomycetota bacterium]